MAGGVLGGFALFRRVSRRVSSLLLVVAALIGIVTILSSTVSAATPSPSLAETARLLGYMWGDGTRNADVWDVNGPSGTSSLIEELVEAHGGEWVDRGRLTFRLPAPYDWAEWKDGLPDDSARVRDAVENPHFLAAVMETEASVVGQIYDQSRCCVPGYTRGRLTDLQQLLRDRGFSTARLVEFGNVDSGKITVDASEWRELRGSHRFVCPVGEDDVRLPGGSDHGQYGNIRWFNANTRWSSVVRTDCTDGQAIPPVQPIPGTCSVELENNDRVRVSWSFTLGEASIRRDGGFVDSVSGRDGSFSESPGDGVFSYEVRLQAFGTLTTANCGSVAVGGAGGGPCTVRAVGDGVRLDWDDFGELRYFVRKNGSWAASITDGSTSATVAQGSLNDVWAVRYRTDGAVVTVPCTPVGAPPPDGPCDASAIAGGVRVDWDPIAGVGTYQIRRNGGWVASVTNATSYDHVGGSIGSTYIVRYRQNGVSTDIPCSV